MKIDRSICDDWALSPDENRLRACGPGTNAPSEPSLCVQVFFFFCKTNLSFFFSCFCLSMTRAFKLRWLLFVLHAVISSSVHWCFLLSVAFLCVGSQVLSSPNNGRQICRLQAATHLSFPQLFWEKKNQNFSPLFPSAAETIFLLRSLGFQLTCCGRVSVGNRLQVWWFLQSFKFLQGNDSLLYLRFALHQFDWHSPLCAAPVAVATHRPPG